jgi:hypothetical protein
VNQTDCEGLITPKKSNLIQVNPTKSHHFETFFFCQIKHVARKDVAFWTIVIPFGLQPSAFSLSLNAVGGYAPFECHLNNGLRAYQKF